MLLSMDTRLSVALDAMTNMYISYGDDWKERMNRTTRDLLDNRS